MLVVVHVTRTTHEAAGRARISSTGPGGTELAVTGAGASTLRVDSLPDPVAADAVRRGLDRILWQSIDDTGGQVYAVAHRRPRRLHVSAATALGLLEAGVPTVVHLGGPA